MRLHDTAEPSARALPLIGQTPVREAKPPIRFADVEDFRPIVGSVIERVRVLAALSLKEFAREIHKEERQIARWIDGTDRPQFDAIWSVPFLRVYLVVAWAELARPDGASVETTISIRRSA